MKRIILLIFILMMAGTARDNKMSAVRVGQPAPVFSLPDMNNTYVFLKDYTGEKLRKPWKNKVHHAVVISFFATWCGPCKKEIPHLNVLQKEYAGKPVKFFLIDVGESGDKVKDFLARNDVQLKVLLDRYKKVSDKYEADSLPRLIVIDKKGVIRKINHGFKDADRFMSEMRGLLDRLTTE